MTYLIALIVWVAVAACQYYKYKKIFDEAINKSVLPKGVTAFIVMVIIITATPLYILAQIWDVILLIKRRIIFFYTIRKAKRIIKKYLKP